MQAVQKTPHRKPVPRRLFTPFLTILGSFAVANVYPTHALEPFAGRSPQIVPEPVVTEETLTAPPVEWPPVVAVAPSNPILSLPPPPEEKSPYRTAPSTTTQLAMSPSLPKRDRNLVIPKPVPPRRESLHAAVKRLKLPLPLPQARIVITKSQRSLELFSGATLVKTYRVALGPIPTGHKQQRGDGRTPEGQFYICTRNAKDSAFHIFLGLSYPALPDATRGVNSKAITWREYQIIRQRLAARGAPLWQTRLGGWVGIHGGTDSRFAQRVMTVRKSSDWTQGCIALTNAEIQEISAATQLGTPVLVQP
ncbi:MAG: L,D-transpeptidase [Armatimonadota bacterium]|nr:L,D-transpeptidase [Armatimonadota bacterium]